MLRASGIEPRDASPEELCRRLAVDVLGRIPSEAELDDCVGQSIEATLDAWMDTEDYEKAQLRFWASELGYDSFTTIWWQIFDLDELVARMVRGEITYDEFAIQTITHPAFVIPRADDGWGAGVFQTFLGRPARRDEMDGTRPLAQMFRSRLICDGRIAERIYQACLQREANGQLEEGEQCRRGCLFMTYEGGVDPCGCKPQGSGLGCYGEGFGEPVDLGVSNCERGEQLHRVLDVSAGEHSDCPDSGFVCPDLEVHENDGRILSGPPADPLPAASTDLHERLRPIGEVVTSRGDFWEAAVDRELRRLLGWWQSGFRQPDFDIPPVRAVLAQHLIETGDLRAVQRLILSSLLYTAPAAVPDDLAGIAQVPPWSAGPRKALVAESWLESAEVVVGEKTGVCDHRFISPTAGAGDVMAALTGQGRQLDSTIDFEEFFPGHPIAGFLANLVTFPRLAADLDGCTFDPRPLAANLSIVSAQGEIASLLCAFGRDVLPRDLDPADVSDATLQAAARYLLRRALSMVPPATEVDAIVSDMKSCIDAGACGDAEDATRWLCARLLDSTAFAVY